MIGLRSGDPRSRRAALAAAVVLGPLVAACSGGPPPLPPIDPAEHTQQVETWRAWRHDQLASPDGWLSLIGLYWLESGHSTFGSGPDADLRVTREDAPALLGAFDASDEEVSFVPAEGVVVNADGAPFAGGVVWTAGDAEGDAPDTDSTTLSHATLSWYVIERDGRLGVRLKDSDSPLLRSFTRMEYFPIAHEWRLSGRFETHDPPRIIKIPNVLGSVSDVESPGSAVFVVDGTEYSLDLWKDSDDPANFFTAFGDLTNNETTYGGGRFLWIDAPDEQGRVVVDFNRSYNPPCAFTPFATCPLPPAQNRLPLRIEAGELPPAGGHEEVQGR